MYPRRVSWLLFLAAAVFFFLAALQQSGAATGLPVWLEAAGLCSLAAGCFLWALPGQPPTVP
jgi:hypothetical protein